MAWHLFRLGRWSFVHRKTVAGLWLLILVAMGAGAATLSGQTNDNFTLDGMESTDAFSLIEERSPGASPDGATARLVIQAPPGTTIDGSQAVITRALAAAKTDHVQSTGAATVSGNGRVGYVTITYSKSAVDLTEADRSALENARTTLRQAGLTAAIGGDALAAETEPPTAEIIGVAVALVVLAVTFGSLVAAGMPLLTAIVGVGIGAAGITTLTGFVELSSTTPALGSMLGLAVGIDYALFIMSRYQHEVRQGRPLEDAAGAAVGTAGSAVIFAGLTVIIALAGLSVTGIGFLTQMGLGGAGMVAVAVLIALTLLPALLGLAGRRVLSGSIRGLKQRDVEDASVRTNGLRWVEAVSRFRIPALVAGVAVAAVISIPVLQMELAIPDDATAPSGSDNRVAYDLISDNFGPGANGPLIVVVDTLDASDGAAAVATVVSRLSGIEDDVAAVVPPVTSTTTKARAAFAAQLEAVHFATVTVIPESGPSDAATKNLVDTIRDDLASLPADTGARALVTGQTAVGVDISQKLTDVFPLYLVVVVGLAFVLLILVFRSILVPLKAALGFLLSVGVALGSTVAVFQWGWLNHLIGLDVTTPVAFILPLLLTGVLFGLAMDYEVFLVTRMREAHVHGTPARQAVIDGFAHSARVVTAAAVIMFGVFAGFALGDAVMIKTIGFALAVGVIADAFLVRMLIVPAVMAIVGTTMWWLPGPLDRALPNLDIEGEALLHRLGPPAGGVGFLPEQPRSADNADLPRQP
ncbi:MMPL family transporter [Kineosporia succinea]|uniref:RND superfamily putative drug exporter n=1 Tax=Kineosporia succinea TaxID=84632 RepID=A0ABT9PDI5_9ACTN|nr:MMPL family transporter [Kineosporia succinea]MDP9830769.1 RND superfamily putative drug exporter [Kineosporia succinea]